MALRTRWRALGIGALALAGLLTLGAVRWSAVRASREFALRTAGTTAAYLSVVTPAARDTPVEYDLPRLLIAVLALQSLPG